uniref:SsDNA binding protein n=1 Tax=Podoviridae sp. ct2nF21 TaxID=2826537 RepID=A0A8S5NHH6_9CAUD|nr:MAG TPA: ssDNA binding protein [Podoviridae sp. ct2nF21]
MKGNKIMITITNTSKEYTPVERYLMTVSPTIKTAKTLEDGDVINVAGYLEFLDEKEDGTVTELMSIITTDNEVYSTQSPTFKRGIKDIVTAMQGCFPFPIKKISGESKAGRKFVDCVLDIDSLTKSKEIDF